MMSSQWTYMERLIYELEMRGPPAKPLSPQGARMERFDRCFTQARKKIKAAKTYDQLHAHEQEALQDAAQYDNITTEALIAALIK